MPGNIKTLNERALINNFDISEYQRYPEEVLQAIVSALEKGCTRRQIDSALSAATAEEMITNINSYIGVPDIRTFISQLDTEGASGDGRDMRGIFKKWDILLTEPGHGWDTDNADYRTDTAQISIDNEEGLSMSRCFPYLLTADELLRNRDSRAGEAVRSVEDRIGGALKRPSFNVMEYVACYTGASGISMKESLRACGKMLMYFKTGTDRSYACMLDCATYIRLKADGYTAGVQYYKRHIPPKRYTVEVYKNHFKKNLVATPCEIPVPFIGKICTLIQKNAKDITEALNTAGGSREEYIVAETLKGADAPGLEGTVILNRKAEEELAGLLDYFSEPERF